MKRPRTRRLRKGALLSLALCLFAGGGLRLTEAALAAGLAPGVTNEVDPAQACVTDDVTRQLMERLKSREGRIETEETALAERTREVTRKEADLAARINDLKLAESDLAETLALSDGAAEKNVAQLVSLYESMKPKEAAPLFAAMAPGFAAGFLTRMRPEAAGKILAGLEPEAAYSISVLMAGRNADPEGAAR